MTRRPVTADTCLTCGTRTGRWRDYFCPDCGEHHDRLYCLEAPDPRPRSRAEIAHEYRIVGMTTEADRLAATVDDPPAPAAERPAPPDTTAFVQRSLLDDLDVA